MMPNEVQIVHVNREPFQLLQEQKRFEANSWQSSARGWNVTPDTQRLLGGHLAVNVFINRCSELCWWLSDWKRVKKKYMRKEEVEKMKGERGTPTKTLLLQIPTSEMQSQTKGNKWRTNWFMLVDAFIIFMFPQWVLYHSDEYLAVGKILCLQQSFE